MRLALFEPDIAQNTGSLLRLGACLGVPVDIIEPCGFVFGEAQMRRAGMDYLGVADYARHPSWDAYLGSRGAGRIVLLSTRAEAVFTDFSFAADDTLLLGRESAGVPQAVHDRAEVRLRIPMKSGLRSINVAQAGAMVLGEALADGTVSTMTDDSIITERKTRARAAFESLRDKLVAEFEAIEREPGLPLSERAPGTFVRTPTARFDDDGSPAGGGVMSVMKGRVFEKVAVNVSTVDGKLSADAAKTLQGSDKDPRFWATSISVIAHMQNPHVPAVHMNTRHMITASQSWFGGGSDLTPMFVDAPNTTEDARDFHAAMQRACDGYRPDAYAEYKKWCDEYFYLPHRKEPRGVGGIFFDRLNSGDWDKDFAFTCEVGLAFLAIYPQIVRRRMGLAWTAADRDHQLVRRGRYVEFNLLWDRGTQFGLKTGHNVDAILVSMPPEVRWP